MNDDMISVLARQSEELIKQDAKIAEAADRIELLESDLSAALTDLNTARQDNASCTVHIHNQADRIENLEEAHRLSLVEQGAEINRLKAALREIDTICSNPGSWSPVVMERIIEWKRTSWRPAIRDESRHSPHPCRDAGGGGKCYGAANAALAHNLRKTEQSKAGTVQGRRRYPCAEGEKHMNLDKADNAAAAFALEKHGSQDHGCLKIGDHLADVAKIAMINYDPHVNILEPEQVIAAAWLHDIIEDTPTTLEEIEDKFGAPVANVVNLLTDKDGRNRLERHLRTYHAIRNDPDATLIKLCDRRHNQSRSLKHGERWMVMYEREYNYFKFALWTPQKFNKLWNELDWQYEEMKRALTW